MTSSVERIGDVSTSAAISDASHAFVVSLFRASMTFVSDVLSMSASKRQLVGEYDRLAADFDPLSTGTEHMIL
jgi:hypothetical protein